MIIQSVAIAAIVGGLVKLWVDSIDEKRAASAETAALQNKPQLRRERPQWRDDPGIRMVNAYAMRNKNQLLRRRRPEEAVTIA